LFRILSDQLIRYRYQHWTRLTDNQQYHIENIEWSLINFCSTYAATGIALQVADADALYDQIAGKMDDVTQAVRQIISAAKAADDTVIGLGTWAMELGAAIASTNNAQVNTLLDMSDPSKVPTPSGPENFADPVTARQIGLCFADISDRILAYHYGNWDQFSQDQRSNLGNMEITILNYNSNFGGLGIALGTDETEALIAEVPAKANDFLQAVIQVSEKGAGAYGQVVSLGNQVMALGAALTEEDAGAIKTILETRVNTAGNGGENGQGPETGGPFDPFELGRELGLTFRHFASLILQYRYANWDTLTKAQAYDLENLEFTLTNFNSDFAVFGVDIDPAADPVTAQAVNAAMSDTATRLDNKKTRYELFFDRGFLAMKLGAAILSQDRTLIRETAAKTEAGSGPPGPEATDALARDIALKMRFISDSLLKHRFGNWDCFSQQAGARLDNIEWTLMNYTSNFSVIGIQLSPGQRTGLLASVSNILDTWITAIQGVAVDKPAGMAELFTLGQNALQMGAVLTTENMPAIKNMLGKYQ